MRLILLGPPASGKGTQAQLLSQRLGLCHISTGNLLRDAVRAGTPAGRKVAPFLASGQLVADDLVNDIVKELFSGDKRPENFVVDGYPRTVPQAVAFDSLLRQQFLQVDVVVHLTLFDEEIVRRISGRLSCSKVSCGASYHLIHKKPKVPGICDLCGSPLFQRDDDKEETVRRRLMLYHQNNDALVSYYQRQGILRELPAMGDIESIYEQLVGILKESLHL